MEKVTLFLLFGLVGEPQRKKGTTGNLACQHSAITPFALLEQGAEAPCTKEGQVVDCPEKQQTCTHSSAVWGSCFIFLEPAQKR